MSGRMTVECRTFSVIPLPNFGNGSGTFVFDIDFIGQFAEYVIYLVVEH